MDDKRSRKWHPVLAYLILVYLLPLPILLLRFFDLPFEPILIYASWTPNLAAVIVLGVMFRERGGIRELFSGWLKWNVGARWYLAAISPLLIVLSAAGIFNILGGKPATPEGPVAVPLALSLMLALITGATGEELGWRGFLLPRLQDRFSALISSLIVGVVWALWHLPLWFLPGYGWDVVPYWSFALGAISSSVLITWVLNNTSGSLVMASIIHWMMNFGMSAMAILGWLPSPSEAWIITSILYATYAIVVVLLTGPKTLSRRLVNSDALV